jgi:integrase
MGVMIPTSSTELSTVLADVGQAANEAAALSAFADYRSRKAENTLRQQDAALALFSGYLAQAAGEAPTGEALATAPEAWRGVTWGLVDGFCKWLLLNGYAVGTVNLRLSTVKTYAKLAAKAGALTAQELAMIQTISGYSRKEGKRIDERREAAEIPTRNGNKKAAPVILSKAQVETLKAQPDTPQGRRDAVLVCLLLDLGLRCGEVAGLDVGNVDIKAGEMRFYRPKVDVEQTHQLINGLQAAMADYLEHDAPESGPLLRASRKGGKLTSVGMTERAITKRVRYLGQQAGIKGLSAHDLRHSWATMAVRNGTPIDRLQDAGGWASPAMPLRYVETARVANEELDCDPAVFSPVASERLVLICIDNQHLLLQTKRLVRKSIQPISQPKRIVVHPQKMQPRLQQCLADVGRRIDQRLAQQAFVELGGKCTSKVVGQSTGGSNDTAGTKIQKSRWEVE